MQIIKNEKSGIAQIWLSNEEHQNERVMNLVECKIKELSGEKFKVAVFRSGSKICTNVPKIFSTIILLSDS